MKTLDDYVVSTPHNHHFIPAFFLKQWAGHDGKLVEYTIKHGKLISKRVGQASTGYEYDLYAFNELPPETAQFIEQRFFDYADRTASEAFRLVLANLELSAWCPEMRSGWSRFVIALHLRHPDAMPELRAAAENVWDGSGEISQRMYEETKRAEDPPTFDEYLALHDPLAHIKMRANLIIKTFDNEILGKHINNMMWGSIDVSAARHQLLISDRSVLFSHLNQPRGYITLPVSPARLFVAVNNKKTLDNFRTIKPDEIVRNANKFAVARARKFVWASDETQTRFVTNNMSKAKESTPLLPNIGWKGENPLPEGSAIPAALYNPHQSITTG